jgi:transcriptional regulator with XRE-family HTH domain
LSNKCAFFYRNVVFIPRKKKRPKERAWMARLYYSAFPGESALGTALRAARKARGYASRLDFAAACGLAGATVQRLEHGRGYLASFVRALEVLGLEVAGPELPSGAPLGARLAALRERRGLSRRALAGLLGVVPDTVGQLEAGRGRLDILERALAVLGAKAHLAPAGRRPVPPPRAVPAAPSTVPAERRRWGSAPRHTRRGGPAHRGRSA